MRESAGATSTTGADAVSVTKRLCASPSFSIRPLPAAVCSALAVEMCRVGGCAYPSHVGSTSYLRPGGICCRSSLRISSHQRQSASEAGRYSWSFRLELRGAKQVKQTIRSVSIESGACGWRLFSRGCCVGSRRTSRCSACVMGSILSFFRRAAASAD